VIRVFLGGRGGERRAAVWGTRDVAGGNDRHRPTHHPENPTLQKVITDKTFANVGETTIANLKQTFEGTNTGVCVSGYVGALLMIPHCDLLPSFLGVF